MGGGCTRQFRSNYSRKYGKGCRVPSCNENHQRHYCKNCENTDSDHKRSQCPYPQREGYAGQNKYNAYGGYSGQNKYNESGGCFGHNKRKVHGGYSDENRQQNQKRKKNNYDQQSGKKQNFYYEKSDKRFNQESYNNFQSPTKNNENYYGSGKKCRVADCKQNHYYHFCKNCKASNSDHFSSDCKFAAKPSSGIHEQVQKYDYNYGHEKRSKNIYQDPHINYFIQKDHPEHSE